MTQGALGFHYEVESSESGLTSLAGLPVFLDLIKMSGMVPAIRRHVRQCGTQGWFDMQVLLALLLLNLAGGDCVDDIERLEKDAGFAAVIRQAERGLLTRKERRALKIRWRKPRDRTFPSASVIRAWLERFHDCETMEVQEKGVARIPAPGASLLGLWAVQQQVIAFLQKHRPCTTATLDMDATLVETNKKSALFSYKNYKAYQPLNCWWAEQQVMLWSEFRDGNVPAGFQHLRVFKDSLDRAVAAGVKKVFFRADTAAYETDLLLYCGEGKDPRYGIIEFAVSADVTEEVRKAARELPDSAWQPLTRTVGDEIIHSGQEWSEICYVPKWVGHSKKRRDYRFLAIREPLQQLDLGDEDQLSFPTEEFGVKGRHKLFAIVTNRTINGNDLILWHRERCGKSEEVHSVLKEDLAGGQMPSGKFGANAAWWALSILSHTLTALLKQLVLGPAWVAKRMKALRFHLINLAGRVVYHARTVRIRIAASSAALETLLAARRTILALGEPPG